jgi:hypothetical protein
MVTNFEKLVKTMQNRQKQTILNNRNLTKNDFVIGCNFQVSYGLKILSVCTKFHMFLEKYIQMT